VLARSNGRLDRLERIHVGEAGQIQAGLLVSAFCRHMPREDVWP
jgi:hypothetical protein